MKKGVAKASTEGQENQKKVSFDTGLKKISRRDSQAEIGGHILDRSFLVRAKAFLNGQECYLREGEGRNMKILLIHLTRGKDLSCRGPLLLPNLEL